MPLEEEMCGEMRERGYGYIAIPNEGWGGIVGQHSATVGDDWSGFAQVGTLRGPDEYTKDRETAETSSGVRR